MNVVLFGATGMVGAGALLECLADPRVGSVVAIGRSPTGRVHPKLREVIQADLFMKPLQAGVTLAYARAHAAEPQVPPQAVESETIMTGAHLHLAFNHVPVVLVPVAAVMLAYAMASRSADLTKGALVLLLVSTLFGAGAFLTGEPAEGAVEQIAGVSTEAIEAHEELAPFAAGATALAGLLALVVLLKWRPGGATPRTMIATLVVAFAAALLLAWTAYLGGRINHPELREDAGATVSRGWGG